MPQNPGEQGSECSLAWDGKHARFRRRGSARSQHSIPLLALSGYRIPLNGNHHIMARLVAACYREDSIVPTNLPLAKEPCIAAICECRRPIAPEVENNHRRLL